MKLPVPLPRLQQILVSDGLITPELFQEIVSDAERKGQDVLDILISRRVADANYLGDLIAKELGVERADFSSMPINKDTVKLVNEEVARQRQIVIFGQEQDGTYDIAMADPGDLETIEFLTQRLKGKMKTFLATQDDLNLGFSVYGYELGQDFKKLIEENIRASLGKRTRFGEEAAADLPIVGIVDNILSYAVASRASDVHLEILEEDVLIRYRIDGILYEILRMPKVMHAPLVARIKLLGGLKMDEHFKPQDGRFRHRIVNQVIDIRVSVVPTYYGEKAELRILEAAQKPLSLEELGMDKENSKIVYDNLKKTYGMILCCGPTGSGKTTTLYALMNILNRPQVNIVTVEDPIEYNMRYINQTQMNPQAGVTFASGLRSLLRQDPNIIMVGEIRDAETADIAVQASLTGHLIMSSLHTSDAPTAVPRLFDLDIPPFLVSSVLNLIIGQRLIRKICQDCVYSYSADPEVGKVIIDQLKESGVDSSVLNLPNILYRGRGCRACGLTGYRGRMGIFEMFEATDKIKKLINSPQFSLETLRAEARHAGMKTMFEDGLRKAELAVTTIEEVLRVMRE